jgi:hypothetical protein
MGVSPTCPEAGLPHVRIEAGPKAYLAYKKTHPPRTLQYAYAQGPMVAPGGVAVSYERVTPVCHASPEEGVLPTCPEAGLSHLASEAGPSPTCPVIIQRFAPGSFRCVP